MSRPSELFEDVFSSGGGGCVRTCACGRLHFDASPNGGWSWDEGELEGYLAKQEKDPDKFLGHDYTITDMMIGGMSVVHGCQCDIAEKYEKFIVAHERQLAEYLNKRAQLLREESDKIVVKS